MSTSPRRTASTPAAPKTGPQSTRSASSKKATAAPGSKSPSPRPAKVPVRAAQTSARQPSAKSGNAKPSNTNSASAKPVQPKIDKVKKPKLVRDSFTIPKTEYAALDELKLRAAKLGHPVKKSELLRAGIKALTAQADVALLATLATVPSIKTGRPKKD